MKISSLSQPATAPQFSNLSLDTLRFSNPDINIKNDRKNHMVKCAAILFKLKCSHIANFCSVCIMQFDVFDQVTCFMNLF